MSTLQTNTIQTSSGGPVTLTKQSAAKAWVYFDNNDNPPVLNGSFNASSLTDNVTEIEVNLTSAMSDLFYCPLTGGGNNSTNPSARALACVVQTTSKIDTELYDTNNNTTTGQCHVAALGDLA